MSRRWTLSHSHYGFDPFYCQPGIAGAHEDTRGSAARLPPVRPDRRLTGSAIEATASQTQVFYTFMVDHAGEAAAATGIARWGEVGPAHTRLWGRRSAAALHRGTGN